MQPSQNHIISKFAVINVAAVAGIETWIIINVDEFIN